LLVVQLAASVDNRLLDCFTSSFEELTLFKLNIALVLLAVNVRNEEGRDQVLDELLRLVTLMLMTVKEFVD